MLKEYGLTSGTVSKGSPSVGTYSTRTWSGADYPSGNPRTNINVKEGYDSVRMWVYRGHQKISVVHKYRFVRLTADKPRRAQREEHAYNMTGLRQKLTYVPYAYNGAGSYNDILTSVGGIPQYVPPQSVRDNYMLALLGKLRENVAGSEFNAGVFLGEGREALSTIADSASRIYGAYHAVKRGNFNLAAQKLVGGTPREHLYTRKHAANNWLQLQYGWLPLLQDASDGAKFLAHHLNYPLQNVLKIRKQPLGFTLNGDYPKSGNLYWTQCRGTWSLSMRAVIKEKDVVQLSGITDPLSVAWELVPYSFVVDWFIPIGNYLSARGLSGSLTGTFVITERSKWKVFSPAIDPPAINNVNGIGYFRGLGDAATDFVEQTSVSRSVSSSIAVPLPSFKPLCKVTSWMHAANAVALLSNLADKKARSFNNVGATD